MPYIAVVSMSTQLLNCCQCSVTEP